MMSFDSIAEFYYGNIRPNEACFEKNENLRSAAVAFQKNEEWLMECLVGNPKRWLSNLVNCHDEILSEASYENFCLGFRLGMKLIIDAQSYDLVDVLDKCG